MTHEKRQRYVSISETSGLKAYKQTCQSVMKLQGPSQCQSNTLSKSVNIL